MRVYRVVIVLLVHAKNTEEIAEIAEFWRALRLSLRTLREILSCFN